MLLAGSALLGAADPVGLAAVPLLVLGTPFTVAMLVFWVLIGIIALYGGSIWTHLRGALWHGRAPGNLGALPTEQRASHDRPGGYKVARLVLDPETEKASFLGLTLGGMYEQEAAAGCEVLAGALPPPRRWGRRTSPPSHEAPDLACTCGFYALRDRSAALELLATRPPVSRLFCAVLLEVDLAGTVIEFDRGYRSAQQRVLGVQVPRWCLPCARQGRAVRAERIAGLGGEALSRACHSDLPQHPPLYRAALAAHNAEVVRRLGGRAALRPVCDAHTPVDGADESVALELADLASGLGTEVRWLEDEAFDLTRYVDTVSWPPPPHDSKAA